MDRGEPTLTRLSNPALRYLLATRPAFLSVTLFAVMIGLAATFADGSPITFLLASVTLVFALVAHAAVNVFNDYYDALSGTDAVNTERIYPYTGGSRFIQNGVLSTSATARFAVALTVIVIAAGVLLVRASGSRLLFIGAAGMFVGWAYSAPPLKLNSRGLGEPCVALGFALIVVGTDYVQRGALSVTAAVASLSYALLVTNILYINQFPDRTADEATGKRHWVVRLPLDQGSYGYAVIGAVANLWLIGAVAGSWLPWPSLLALLAAPLTVNAARDLVRHAGKPAGLRGAIEATIAAACAHGALLATGLALSRVFE